MNNRIKDTVALKYASILILLGGFAAMHVIIIGGQAFPLNIFPDHIILDSAFYDNVVHSYTPSIFEFILGLGGVALALIITLIGIANFKFLPIMISSAKVKTEKE